VAPCSLSSKPQRLKIPIKEAIFVSMMGLVRKADESVT
jgi:hypothetical protein